MRNLATRPSAVDLARTAGVRAAGAGVLAVLLAGCGAIPTPQVARPDPAVLSALERASSNECNPSVASVLTGSGVQAPQIRSVAYGLYRDEIRDRIVRYDAWIGLTNQPGAIVVTVDDDCRPIQIYARGGARLPDAAR
ncbi:hypothetical protein TSO352_31375 [Azospirillum sp. TSO35-2]|nr:hypothetical protein TSO352_31375 [Azospirillum sp. TSO35-2]